MDLTLTEDQELVKSTAREFLGSRGASGDARAMAGDPLGYSPELWKEMAGLGWTGLAVPERYGGVGEGFLELCLLIEEMARAQVPGPLLTTAACCGMAITRYGTEEQKQELLGEICRGRVVGYARAAPQGRWVPAGSEVAASQSGDGFVLDGPASFVPYAHAAGDLIVVTQGGTPGDPADEGDGGLDRLTVFLVDTGSPGVAREQLGVVGTDRMCRVRFDRVHVPGSRILGGSGQAGAGRPVVEAISAYGAAASCAAMVGDAQGVLDATVGYAAQRQQFGKPIGVFQAVSHHCADMAIDVLSSRLIAYEAIWRLSRGLGAAAEIAVAKSWVGDACERVCSLGHQVHGAVGFTMEHHLHWWLRHATASALAFGDAAFHTEQVANSLGI
jgi:3-oxocholest-4-en-26-oyl-CoA dehydrogenase beta subunit